MLFSPVAIRILQRRREALIGLHSARPTSDITLTDGALVEDEADVFVGRDAGDHGCQIELRNYDQSQTPQSGDVTYEDALLDAQARYFFSAEYGHAQPSEGVLSRVLTQMEVDSAPMSDPRPGRLFFSPQAIAAVYGALTRPIVSRLVPGSVALLLLGVLMGSNVSQLLSGTPQVEESDAVYTPSVAQLGPTTLSRSQLELRIGERLDAPPTYLPDSDMLDPVELGQPRQKRDYILTSPRYRIPDEYRQSAFGPQ